MYEALGRSISEQFNNTRTATQCETRFKTIKKRKTEVRTYNKTSGNTRKNVPFEDEFEQIAALDDSIEPEVMMGVSAVQVNAKRKVVKENENRLLKRTKSLSNADILRNLHKQREENKDRRHAEKLAYITM